LLSPIAQIVEISHNVVLYGILPNSQDMVYTIVVCTAIFIIGIVIFNKKEPLVIDEL